MSGINLSVIEELKFTYADYLSLPDNDKQYEILDGDLVMSPAPTPRHQIVLLNIASILKLFVEQHHLGQIFIAPCDVVLTEYDVVQPDIFFIASAHLNRIKPTKITGSPDLVIEILSPQNALRDLNIKRKIYARQGVMEYWLVYPDKNKVQIMRLQQGNLQQTVEFSINEKLTSPFFPGLELPMNDIF